jgi:hypothetical protein
VRRAAERVGVGGFEIGYVTDDGLEHRVSLSQAWATPFESCSPIRRFTSHKGQRHLSGLWWSATTGGHVGFESWMERDHVMALDFDPTVVGIASQPFWLSWRDDAGTDLACTGLLRSPSGRYFGRSRLPPGGAARRAAVSGAATATGGVGNHSRREKLSP